MLFPHLLLFPYQPAYDSASSASKLCKTQGKLPQRDATLLFPLASSSSSSSSLFSLSLNVTNQSVYLSTGCTLWECSLKPIQCPPLPDSCLFYGVRGKKLLTESISSLCGEKGEQTLLPEDTDGHFCPTCPSFIVTFFSENWFVQRLSYYHLVAWKPC